MEEEHLSSMLDLNSSPFPSISTVESTYPTVIKLPPSSLQTDLSSNSNNGRKITKRKNKRGLSVFSTSSSSSTSLQRGLRVTPKQRNSKAGVQFRGESDLNALALPLGMSFAAVVAQVLEQKCISDGRISADHLSSICSSAVNESLVEVFGNRFDCFVRNFEKAFGSTLRTLRLINGASQNKEEDSLSHLCKESQSSELAELLALDKHGHSSSSCDMKSHLEDTQDTSRTCKSISFVEEVQENTELACKDREVSLHGETNQQQACVSPSNLDSGINDSVMCTFEKSVKEKESLVKVFGNRFDCLVGNFEKAFGSTLCTLRLNDVASQNEEEDSLSHSYKDSQSSECAELLSLDKHGHSSSNCNMKSHLEDIKDTSRTSKSISFVEEVQENTELACKDQEVSLHGEINQQLACVVPNNLVSGINDSVMRTFEKSVREQSRSNDLKTFEIGLMMKRLQLEESQLKLTSASNHLEKFKLSFGISKASFKAEKFKNQLEETRHAELLKKCIDCLVAGLVIMSTSLVYGAYVYSYERLSELTTSCMTPPKVSTSWWTPKSVSSFSSGLHMLRCQILVASRMLFGVFMILAVAYLLLQRSSAFNQSMPITFILLLLGVLCGFAGKLCVDTLGGSGYEWLLYWEALCLVHFFANVCTSTLFSTLHGSVSVSQGVIGARAIMPYWFRRFAFYSITVFLLPLFCGLMPFAGFSDWKEHFFSLAKDSITWPINV